jgi:hypothetical protein
MHALWRRSSGSFWLMMCCLVLAIVELAVTPAPAPGDEPSRPAAAAASVSSADALATPTHHQTGVIDINGDGRPHASLTCFCVSPDNRILAGCVSATGEIRVFDGSGKYLESWSVPIKPEAIFGVADGTVLLAGEGQLAKLSATGKLESQHEAPHAAAIAASRDKIREEVIEQNKRQATMYAEQVKAFDQMLDPVQKKIDELKAQIAALDNQTGESAATDSAASEPTNGTAVMLHPLGSKQILGRQLVMQEQMKQRYEQSKSQWEEMIKQNPAHELSDAEIEGRITSSMQYKMKVSSISANDQNVFLAAHGAVGYGFDVWKMSPDFENAQPIISNLSGCCGQMDVKVNADGLYVAENSRHRVCHYDSSGKLIDAWGEASRSGIEGFGSCCNPMNVAFGPGGVIYTAEDDTGRIKRYSPKGELLGLVGAVDVPPGCKNVSIAASNDGGRFYMLDITNSRILQMEPYGPGETPRPMKFEEKRPADASQLDTQTSENDSGASGAMRGVFQLILGGSN